jgi:hypothetical protein
MVRLSTAVCAATVFAACGIGVEPASVADDLAGGAASATAPPEDRVDDGGDGTAGADDEPGAAAATLPRLRLGEPIAVVPDALELRVRPGTDEMYVADRLGRIHRLGDGVVLDLSESIEAEIEEGLLGMVFSPAGDAVYLNIVSESVTRVVELLVDAAGAILPDPPRTVIEFDQPYEAHNGGELLFDTDGMLLVFTGDGGFFGDPDRVALDRTSPLGKILRVDPTPDGDRSYQVPDDNPFTDGEGWAPLVWSYGLRNPWRGHLDPATGDLWIGDIGDFGWEELNVGWGDEGAGRGLSFGWSAFEGPDRYNDDQPAGGHTLPFHAYPHGDGGRCSVTAGEVYRGTGIDALDGWFVFSDFCDGVVRAIEVTPERTPGREIVAEGTVPIPVSIRSGPDGELYVVSIEGSIVPLLAAD